MGCLETVPPPISASCTRSLQDVGRTEERQKEVATALLGAFPVAREKHAHHSGSWSPTEKPSAPRNLWLCEKPIPLEMFRSGAVRSQDHGGEKAQSLQCFMCTSHRQGTYLFGVWNILFLNDAVMFQVEVKRRCMRTIRHLLRMFAVAYSRNSVRKSYYHEKKPLYEVTGCTGTSSLG